MPFSGAIWSKRARKAQDVQLPPSFPRGYDDEVGKPHRCDDIDDDGEHGEHFAGVSRRGSLDGEVAFAGVEGDVGAVYLFAQFRKPRRVAVKMQENGVGERAHILCDEVVRVHEEQIVRGSFGVVDAHDGEVVHHGAVAQS